MCGRFALSAIPQILLDAFGFPVTAEPSRYNIAPTQTTPVVLQRSGSSPELHSLRWGLVPRWARDAAGGARLVNARAETVAEKPAFREAFARRRCLVPASGFYEWRREGDGKRRTPFYFTSPQADHPLVFAGLWEVWEGGAEALATFTIITTAANRATAAVHDRLPAILARGEWRKWLDPDARDHAGLKALLRPADPDHLAFWQVSDYVNKVGNEGEKCLDKAE